MAGVEQITVEQGEAGMRLDRWFKTHYPGLGFGHLQKLLRSGQIRVDGGRAKADSRLEPGQVVRVPPLGVDRKGGEPLTAKSIRSQDDGSVLRKMMLCRQSVFVQQAIRSCGAGQLRRRAPCRRHAGAFRNKKGEKPRLVHRLDRDTSGVVVARSRLAAMKR